MNHRANRTRTKVRRYWTPAEVRKMRRLYPNMDNEAIGKRLGRPWYSVQNKAGKLGLRKSEAFLRSPACRFQPGMIPWNLGKTGYMGANRTSFRKGHKPQTWRPVGSECMTRDGTLLRKVRDTRHKPRDWKPVKDIVWEAKRGPIPAGFFVVHKNRDRADFRLRNLGLVDRVANMLRNTYHRYPKEIARLIQLRGALNRQINKRASLEEQNRGSKEPPIRDAGKGEGRRHAARPGEDGRGDRASHHQQRQGGKRVHQGRGREQGNRLHSRGRAVGASAAAGAR